MKSLAFVAAAMFVASTMAPVTASAAPAPRHHVKWKKVCKNVWKHGRKHRVCRNVRVYR